MDEKLFKDMTPEEQLGWLTDFSKFSQEKLPLLEQLGDTWEACHIKSMKEGLVLLNAFQVCRDFVSKSFRYGDYSARVKRFIFYMDLVRKKIDAGEGMKGANGESFAFVAKIKQSSPRRGRPASAETIARREAEAKAARQQATLFGEDAQKKPAADSKKPSVSPTEASAVPHPSVPFIAPGTRDDAEYKLSVAQIRTFLSADLQQQADQIRALRTTAGAAAEKAKTMAELKTAPELVAPVAEQAQRTLEQVKSIYAAIDEELAALWYRLQNGSPEWKDAWMKRYGFKGSEDLHPDLIHDLRKHYRKVTEANPGFDAKMRLAIEEESPEYIEKQKQEAARKKEVQDILRYMKRKDKGQKVATARQKFSRLEELLGKKEAAVYKPLLAKIEDEQREAQASKEKKPSEAKKKAK